MNRSRVASDHVDGFEKIKQFYMKIDFISGGKK